MERKLSTIFALDVVGFSKLMAKDEANTLKTLNKRPNNNELLKLYALFKQATIGNVSGKRPSLINVKERAKWDAWKAIEGTEKSSAMENYNVTVDNLVQVYGTK